MFSVSCVLDLIVVLLSLILVFVFENGKWFSVINSVTFGYIYSLGLQLYRNKPTLEITQLLSLWTCDWWSDRKSSWWNSFRETHMAPTYFHFVVCCSSVIEPVSERYHKKNVYVILYDHFILLFIFVLVKSWLNK